MKQISITKYGNTDVLKIQERENPKPSAGELLIKVKAIGVNFADILARKGLMNANKIVFEVNLGHMWNERNKIGGWMQEILKGVEEGWVRPHVDITFLFEQVGEAHAYIEARKNIVKIVLVTGG